MKRIGIGPILMLIFVLVPLMLLAFPQPPTGNTGAPGDGNCTSCHSGLSTGGSVVITFPSGLNYTPGVTQHLSATVNDTTHSVYSFQITARLASNTSTQAGSFTATDTVNTIVQTSGTIQDIETTNSGINQSTWNFDWTPPSTNVGNVNFYVTGLAAGGSGGATSGNGIYNASYSLTPPVATLPTLALSPTSLSFSVQQGGAAPTAQTVSVTSGGTPVSYTVASSGGTWLSTSTTSGNTPGAFSVSVNPTGLAAGTYNGTLTVTSSGVSNSPQTVPVTLTVTPAVTNTLSVTPSTLTFAYQSGASAPAAQTVSVSSSGSALSFTAAASATGGNWLSVTPTSGMTPGTVSVSVNPTGLAAGTFAGTVTIASAGAAGSPQTVAVTLVVSGGGSGSAVTVAPSTLRFATSGSTDDDRPVSTGIAPQKLTISPAAGSSNVTYTVAETTTSGGHWLTAGPTQGTTPGTVTVSANAAGLAAGTYHGAVTITPSGTSAQAISVPVTLVVGTPQTVTTLRAYPSRLLFSDPVGGASSSKTVRITSTGAPLTFSAASHGGTWLTVSPMTGTTPSTLSVTVDPHGLAAGAYSGVISLTSGSQRAAVGVRLYVATGSGEGGTGTEAEVRLSAVPMVNDPTGSGAVGAEWLDAAGVPSAKSAENGVGNSGLALTKTAKAPLGTSAGALIVPADSLTTLTELGFDIRQGTHCTANSPHFLVVTSDDVTHLVTGCANGTTQAAPAPGWIRVQFDPSNAAQTKPAIAPGQTIKSIAIVLDEGPEASPHVGGGLAVIDNVTVNGTVVKEQ